MLMRTPHTMGLMARQQASTSSTCLVADVERMLK